MIEPLELLKHYHAALNSFDLDEVERMFAEDAVYVSPGLNGEIKGRSAIMQAMRTYFAEYADQASTDENVEQLDKFRARSTWSLQATNKFGAEISRRGEEIIHFNIDGLIERIEVLDHL